jgi:hypothetical protein
MKRHLGEWTYGFGPGGSTDHVTVDVTRDDMR